MDKFEQRKNTIYALMCDELYVPMKVKEIASLLDIPKTMREELREVLDALLAEGRIEVSKKGKYAKARRYMLTGVFESNVRGFGFVRPDDGSEDIFIGKDSRGGAVHGDSVRVVIRSSPEGKRREGTVTEVIAHGKTRVVGTYEASRTFGFVVPDNARFGQDIFVALEHAMGAVAGHKVVVELTEFGGDGRKPEGRIVEILGHVNDPGTDILSIVRDYELPVEFPEKVLNQAVRVGKPVSEADMAGRLDLRGVLMVTIDGEDAKDLDDAVSLTMEGENYRLGVHIADVSNYVQERSALDAEALARGTSVYLVDRVIPMLPHTLSNGICSLNAGEDRLALSCIMLINPKGEVIDYQIAETVINVDARMSYTSVNKILSLHDEQETARYEALVPMFCQMAELAARLRGKRKKRGSIDFDFPETKIILDATGFPVEIRPYERNVATDLIEDFMLIANETVAEDNFWQELPFVYRTHGEPDPDRIRKLSAFIHNFGYNIHTEGDEMHPKELQKLLEKIADTPQEMLISRLTLRSMKQAKYTVDCTGHFGLAAKYYCHFTSPIRRYPDLQIHRIIKERLRGRLDEKRKEHYEKILPEVAKQSSERERRAEEAERETVKLKKVQYMSKHIGETFTGVISSVTAWGMYVELPDTIEGMVHVTALKDDFSHFVEDSYELVGEVSGRCYKLGQTVEVVVVRTDELMRTIDFELADVPADKFL